MADRSLSFFGQALSNLHRTPLAPDQLPHPLPLRNSEACRVTTAPPGFTEGLRLLGSPAAPAPVAPQLAGNRGFVHRQSNRGLALIKSRLMATVYLVSLLPGKLRVVFHRCSFDWPVGKAAMLPQLAHSARQLKLHFRVESTHWIPWSVPHYYGVRIDSYMSPRRLQ